MALVCYPGQHHWIYMVSLLIAYIHWIKFYVSNTYYCTLIELPFSYLLMATLWKNLTNMKITFGTGTHLLIITRTWHSIRLLFYCYMFIICLLLIFHWLCLHSLSIWRIWRMTPLRWRFWFFDRNVLTTYYLTIICCWYCENCKQLLHQTETCAKQIIN